jgi:TRAP-type C4-dicarboxylate transport system permease small subunit
MWDYWFYGMIILFIIAVSWIVLTPVYNQFTAAISIAGEYSDIATNTSMHNLVGYNDNTWNKWPLVATVVIFLIIFYFAIEDKPVYRLGG